MVLTAVQEQGTVDDFSKIDLNKIFLYWYNCSKIFLCYTIVLFDHVAHIAYHRHADEDSFTFQSDSSQGYFLMLCQNLSSPTTLAFSLRIDKK